MYEVHYSYCLLLSNDCLSENNAVMLDHLPSLSLSLVSGLTAPTPAVIPFGERSTTDEVGRTK